MPGSREWLSELRCASAPLNLEGTMTATQDTESPHLETELSSGHCGHAGGRDHEGVPQFSRGREVRPISLRFHLTQGGAVPQRIGEGILVSFLWKREEGPRQSLV